MRLESDSNATVMWRRQMADRVAIVRRGTKSTDNLTAPSAGKSSPRRNFSRVPLREDVLMWLRSERHFRNPLQFRGLV